MVNPPSEEISIKMASSETPMLREDVGQLDVAKLFDHFESH
jgi:hypothetical protein